MGYPTTKRVRGLASCIKEAAWLHQDMGNFAKAEIYASELINRVIERAAGKPTKSVDVGRAYFQRAEVRASSGKTLAAVEDLELAIPILSDTLGTEHEETVEARELMTSLARPEP